jgi:hypothetical protein
MKNMLRKYCLPVVAALSLLFTSCDANDLYLEDEIVGSWSWIYEDANVFEEEVYDFDPTGRWTSRYIYENAFGECIYEVDAGTYNIDYGVLELKSNFTGDIYTFAISIYGDRLLLSSGEYSGEFFRYR